ncbi:hypothetical protein B0H13DRAFT_2325587 [Mycena leptocephala]|nr:hypothetical protein B0H13DRAFT_2325587 [Mycena leptocephala]
MTASNDVALFQNPMAILHWMAQNEDSEMRDVWNDSDAFIEDRNAGGEYHDCRLKSRWDGKLPKPTFVYGMNATIGMNHPPSKGHSTPPSMASSGSRGGFHVDLIVSIVLIVLLFLLF